uniref:Thyroglobulin type-1 domain-containing protein n=1 Tax=Heterorhabditis bacteriophora TaxID=37862 RepID=A0A1I7X6Z5_HETBA
MDYYEPIVNNGKDIDKRTSERDISAEMRRKTNSRVECESTFVSYLCYMNNYTTGLKKSNQAIYDRFIETAKPASINHGCFLMGDSSRLLPDCLALRECNVLYCLCCPDGFLYYLNFDKNAIFWNIFRDVYLNFEETIRSNVVCTPLHIVCVISLYHICVAKQDLSADYPSISTKMWI